MHLADMNIGLLGSFAIVGAGIPVALGAAMSFMYRGEDRVAMTFFGDGATNIGTFHESLNMAAVWHAPLVLVIENNLYGEYSSIKTTTPIADLAIRGASYGIPSTVVDGQDVEAVHAVAVEAVQRARAGGGPTLIEAKTYRYRGHSRTDPGRYRPSEELELWKNRDPLGILGDRLTAEGILSVADREEINRVVRSEIDVLAEEAAAAEFPTTDVLEGLVYAS
jgi:pyruvate dehydrogenase E1 component alpha subunit